MKTLWDDTHLSVDDKADRVEFLEWGDRNQSSAASRPDPSFSQSQQGADDFEDDMPDSFQAIDEDVPF